MPQCNALTLAGSQCQNTCDGSKCHVHLASSAAKKSAKKTTAKKTSTKKPAAKKPAAKKTTKKN